MHRYIYGVLYKTENSRRIDARSGGDPKNGTDWQEILYARRDGSYFMHVTAGPEVRAGSAVRRRFWVGNEGILPLSFEQASQWCKEHSAPELYEKEFGALVSRPGKMRVDLTVPADLYSALRREAVQGGMTLGEYINLILEKRRKTKSQKR